MTPLLFPLSVTGIVWISWMAWALWDACVSRGMHTSFDCGTSMALLTLLASGGSALAGLMALLARVLLHPWLSYHASPPEWKSAIIAGLILFLLLIGLWHWERHDLHLGIYLFGWLGASFVVSSLSLMIAQRIEQGQRTP